MPFQSDAEASPTHGLSAYGAETEQKRSSYRAFSGCLAAARCHTSTASHDMRKAPSPFEDLLAQHRISTAMEAKALKRVIAEQIEASMRTARLTKLEMAQKMGTSRSQLDRVLDPSNVSVQLDTLIKAARAVGKELIVGLRPMAKQVKAR